MNADISPRTSRGPHHIGAQVAGVSRVKRVPTDIVERALLWVFIAGLAWCPVWFGSVTLLAWGINAVLFSGLVAIYELSLLIRGERHPVAMKQIKAPAALFAAVVLWILIQNATWTPDWLHHPIWQMTADELDRSVAGSISVDRDLTSLALLRLITAASVFWIALQLCRNASRANILLISVAALSCAYAAYGLFAFVYMPGRVLWVASPFPRTGFITSTFINPNSFATYAGMGLVVIFGLILRLYRNEFIVGWWINSISNRHVHAGYWAKRGVAVRGGPRGLCCPSTVAIARRNSLNGLWSFCLGSPLIKYPQTRNYRATWGYYSPRGAFGSGRLFCIW